MPAIEDKVVQMGITRVLNAIYEPNFLSCSYGFRQRRGCLQALKQLDKGRFKVGRKTRRQKMTMKLKEMNLWLKSVRNAFKWKDIWKVLAAKLRGHYEYYGISGNFKGIKRFYWAVVKIVYKWMNRRSQKKSMNWSQFTVYLERFTLPKPTLRHNIYICG